ncbi:hypothetical protein DEU56DRAFT_911905 [Suillus clintonianus]|uniref:uncharacterized protein n=1 Tax=Suillus clintonianus TaxID=1904413 RepID=UPI001B884344|nr:uncharacterized protein DEU56DRAFT_911905 [Suillus clintonianus]KAG2139648.1 hypothetical protein DEU56DRAFT_911905 [Suillus clintonianus]
MHHGREDLLSNNSAISRTDNHLTLLADIASNDNANMSCAPTLDPNLENLDLLISRRKIEPNINVSKSHANDNELDVTTSN